MDVPEVITLSPSQDCCAEAPLQESHEERKWSVRGQKLHYPCQKKSSQIFLRILKNCEIVREKGSSLNTPKQVCPQRWETPPKENQSKIKTFCPLPLLLLTFFFFFSSDRVENLVTNWGEGEMLKLGEGTVERRARVRPVFLPKHSQPSAERSQKHSHIKPG